MSGHSFPSSSWMFASPPCKAGFVMFGFWVRSAPHGTPRITCGGGEGDTPIEPLEEPELGWPIQKNGTARRMRSSGRADHASERRGEGSIRTSW